MVNLIRDDNTKKYQLEMSILTTIGELKDFYKQKENISSLSTVNFMLKNGDQSIADDVVLKDLGSSFEPITLVVKQVFIGGKM